MALLAIALIAAVLLPEAAAAEPISLSGLAPALGEAGAGGASPVPQALVAEAGATRAAFRAAKGRVKGVLARALRDRAALALPGKQL